MPNPKVITDGTKLAGSAMPGLLAGFREAVIGHTIRSAGYFVIDGEPYPFLVLSNGETIIAQCDDECNGPGTLVLSKSDAVLCRTNLAT